MTVKDLMIPVGEYRTIGKDAVFGEVAAALAENGHRDVLVVDKNGNLAGVLTMTDIMVALEPNYKKLGKKDLGSDTLSNRYVSDIFKEFGLWSDTLTKICRAGYEISVAEAMYVPAETEYLEEDDDLEHAIHRFIIGTHQPLIVRKNGTITGVLRLGDVFGEITRRMTACHDS
ncbi:HPP family protein [Pseudodesulfovibrio sp.]|uniref:CBS domain-containing protein n=1 Tax=unclassified Pseudodesulfovibrio TaxID=2661612 RepID=UPI003B00C02C